MEQHQEFARAIAGGVKIVPALIQAGYSRKQAKKGWAIVNRSRGLRLALAERGKLLRDLGQGISAGDQENLVRGRLVLNTIQGCDKGVASAKALGADKRVSMWQPESAQGVIVVVPPPKADPAKVDEDV